MKKYVYLDNGATTKVHPQVVQAMLPFYDEFYGNPSSVHKIGRQVKVEIENAREIIAEFINADPSEIYFMSGGTEANNSLISGILKTEEIETGRKGVITTKMEHPAVLEIIDSLKEEGFHSKFTEHDLDGNIALDSLQNMIESNDALISSMFVNNEIGLINPIKEIVQIAKSKNLLTHTDAVQCFGKLKLDVKELGVDALTATAHKIYGPKGIGIAYIKNGTPMASFIKGGSQERKRRGGTENVAGIMGLTEAVKIAKNEMDENYSKISKLNKMFREGIESIDSNGISFNRTDNTSPYILSVSFHPDKYKIDSEAMIIFLDINGVAASSGSACNSGTIKASHVIKALGKTDKEAGGTLRFSFGRYNTEENIIYALDVFKKLTDNFRLS